MKKLVLLSVVLSVFSLFGMAKALAANVNCQNVLSNPQENIPALRKAAEAGNVEAQVKLAEYYYDGTGVEKNFAEAARWYKKAAAQGNTVAMN